VIRIGMIPELVTGDCNSIIAGSNKAISEFDIADTPELSVYYN